MNHGSTPPARRASGKTYLVGGAVRDGLLGLPVRERDWVVVGATAAEMLAQGYKQVGRDFPVFLDPRAGAQHALARTERKTGPGHTDFTCHAAPSVTLEEDLLRRDLTINAMAKDGDRLIDPTGARRIWTPGCCDTSRRLSPRIRCACFRVARFAAQLPSFRIADEPLPSWRRCGRSWRRSPAKGFGPNWPRPPLGQPLRFFETASALDGAVWLERLNLDATVALFRRRAFRNQASALVAIGWAKDRDALASTFSRLKAPRLTARAATAVAGHGAALVNAKTGRALLEALAAIRVFRPGPRCRSWCSPLSRTAPANPCSRCATSPKRYGASAWTPPPAPPTAWRCARLASPALPRGNRRAGNAGRNAVRRSC